jgi:hypothetical protein
METTMIRTLGLAAVAALTIAAGARAETVIPPYPSAGRTPVLATPLNLKPAGPVELRYAQAPTPLPRGVARTSVERRAGGVTGSAGVLCGLQPNMDNSGVGTARGYDNEGRFVGAKLAFSF